MKPSLSVMGAALGLVMTFGFTACTQQSPNQPGNTLGNTVSTLPGLSPGQLVQSSQVTMLDMNRPSVAPDTNSSSSVQVTMTVDRDALLSQEFLYGADLQYSSVYDKDLNLYNQSMALGHIPARFRIAGNELQLIADDKRSYPSDVNHPELLLSRYKILAQSDAIPANGSSPARPATLSISGANSSFVLSQFFASATSTDPTPKPLRDLWIRSFDYVPAGNYLLQQTSVVLMDGTIGEFMESVFPRSNLTPGRNFTKFAMNPDDAVGASDGPVARFRMLPGEKVYEGETAVSYAQHFDISPNADGTAGTVDFYVTRNIPDEAIQPVKLAVEGWNRYFLQYKGIQRPVMQFKGRLPEGIYLGDPRYNVINWDSRTVAGAAYESQATDPYTGKQSHSVIYMPAAWLAIGATYWNDGQYSDSGNPRDDIFSVSPASLALRNGAFRSSRIACLKDVHEGTRLLASGRLTDSELAEFPVQLLKQTLFHEVGHSLGLAHNFKGSLSFDRSNPKSAFTASIMDYNDFENERRAFYAVDSWDGPQLEYDRQAIGAIYNQGLDIAATDPVMPACNDAEADVEAGGVDPLCIRYDIEKDPTLAVNTAYKRITEENLQDDVTLGKALENVAHSTMKEESLKTIQSRDQLDALISNAAKALQGVMKFYIVSGKESFSKNVVLNVKSLLVFEDNVLPAGYDEQAMRERAFSGVTTAAGLLQLPKNVGETLEKVSRSLIKGLEKSPYVLGLKKEESDALSKSVIQTFSQTGSNFESDATAGLPALRTAVFTALKRHPQVAFYLGTLGATQGRIDYEMANLGILSDATTNASRTVQERVAAATSLVTYRGRLTIGDQMISQAVTQATVQRDLATDNQSRENAEAVLTALK